MHYFVFDCFPAGFVLLELDILFPFMAITAWVREGYGGLGGDQYNCAVCEVPK